MSKYNKIKAAINKIDFKKIDDLIQTEDDLLLNDGEDYIWELITYMSNKDYIKVFLNIIEKKSVSKKIDIDFFKLEEIFRDFFDDMTDEYFIELFSKIKLEIPLTPELISSVYYCNQTSIKSLKWLINKEKVNINGPFSGSGLLYYTHSLSPEQISKLQWLIANGANVNEYWECNDEYDKDYHVLRKFFVEQNVDLVNLTIFISNGSKYNGFLHTVIKAKSKRAKKYKLYLIKLYFNYNPNVINDYHKGFTIIQLALLMNELKIAKYLIGKGADINLATKNKKTKSVNSIKVKAGLTVEQICLKNKIDINSLSKKSKIEEKQPFPELSIDFHNKLNAIKSHFIEFKKICKDFSGIEELTIDTKLPEVPEVLKMLVQETWGTINEEQLKLIHISLVLGNTRIYYNAKESAGGFKFASWIELINKNIFSYYDDIGVSFANPTKKGVKLSFGATYESHKVFRLNLTVDQYIDKLKMSCATYYWHYYFTNPKFELTKWIEPHWKDTFYTLDSSYEEFIK